MIFRHLLFRSPWLPLTLSNSALFWFLLDSFFLLLLFYLVLFVSAKFGLIHEYYIRCFSLSMHFGHTNWNAVLSILLFSFPFKRFLLSLSARIYTVPISLMFAFDKIAQILCDVQSLRARHGKYSLIAIVYHTCHSLNAFWNDALYNIKVHTIASLDSDLVFEH